jgi:predicted DNA-binding protein (UPF0251 family)
MSRPPKCRRVAHIPAITYFKPAGIPLRSLGEVVLSVEEIEALRLKDVEGLEQEQGAERMNISRPTFQRVLTSARQKIADAILNGKAMNIKGGNFEMAFHRFRCRRGHEWDLETPSVAPPELCPRCSTPNVEPLVVAGLGHRAGNSGKRYGASRGGR